MAENISIRFTGDLVLFQKFLNVGRFKNISEKHLRRATLKSALMLVRAAQINIRQGKDFAGNAPLTLALKSSNRPLIDKLNLLRAIRYELQSSFRAEIGVFKDRFSTGSKGKGHRTLLEMQKLVELLESGFVIKVTPKMRAAVMAAIKNSDSLGGAKKKKALDGINKVSGTATYRVPPRKVLSSVWTRNTIQAELRRNWNDALEAMFREQGAK